MHPRNPYRDKPPDFKALALEYPEFRKFCQYVNNGKVLFDFREDAAVRCLTKTLLKKDFSLEVDLPSGHLVPRVPQKLNYCLLIDDLLSANNLNEDVVGIDIGTGTSCIHALIGARRFGWKFVATEGDPVSVQTAHTNVKRNGLGNSIGVVHVNPNAKTLLMDVVSNMKNTNFAFCMCNPPFFDKPETDPETKFKFCEEPSGSRPFFSNRIEMNRTSPHSITIASAAELFVEGGEIAFVNRIIDDSVCLRDRIKIYTTMLGRKQSVKPLIQRLKRFGDDVKFFVSPLNQGKTKRWMLAWTFVKDVHFTALEQPVSINCSKPGMLKVIQQIGLLNGSVRREEPEVLIVEFRSVTWTHQRARRRAEADLHSSAAKKSKLNTVSVGSEATLGTCDGKDSFTNAGNFVISEEFETADQRLRDNATQAYFPLPDGVVPRPVIRLRITVKSGSVHDVLQFEILSGAKHFLYQVVQYFRNRLT